MSLAPAAVCPQDASRSTAPLPPPPGFPPAPVVEMIPVVVEPLVVSIPLPPAPISGPLPPEPAPVANVEPSAWAEHAARTATAKPNDGHALIEVLRDFIWRKLLSS